MSPALRAAVVAILLIGCGGDDEPGTADANRPDADVIDAPEVDATELDAQELDATEVDAPIDAQDLDAIADAPGPALPFHLAYAGAWTFRGITGVTTQSTALVINPAANGEPLDLSGLEVVSVVDDHPAATVRFLIPVAAAAPLPAGNAAGNLSMAAETHIGPLVGEPRADNNAPSLGFSISDLPMPVNTVIHATVVLRNGSQQVTLALVFTLQATGVGAAATGATRVTSTPL